MSRTHIIEFRQLSKTRVTLDDNDLAEHGLTIEDLERAAIDEDYCTKIMDTTAYKLIPDIVTPDELLSLAIIESTEDDPEDITIGKQRNMYKTETVTLVEDYKCNKCGSCGDERSIISMTEAVFVEEPDPHMSWYETHKCHNCGNMYQFKNAT